MIAISYRDFGKTMRALCTIVAIAMLLACGGARAARQDDTESRKLALVQLQNRDAMARTAACAVLAEIGNQDDLPLLQSHLFDDDDGVRGKAEAAIWAIWSRSGDAAADRLLERGVEQMQAGHLKMAVDTFGRVLAMRPEFTEAWNKRATVYFLLGEDDLSLKDCDEVLKRNPQHFGVLAGYGQIYLRKGDLFRALDYFEQALAINPNMAGVQASVDALREILIKRGRRFI
jgi:tetratricopeptide (TPR) repeat protein